MLQMKHAHILEVLAGSSLKIQQVTLNSKLGQCIVMEDSSIFLVVIRALLDLQNLIIDRCLQMAAKRRLKCLGFLYAEEDAVQIQSISLGDLSRKDVINFQWDETLLSRFSQCKTSLGLGRHVDFDIEKIEMEVAHEILHGKKYITVLPTVPKVIFTDELFQSSIQLMKEVSEKVPQETLQVEVMRGVQSKLSKSPTYVNEMQTMIGMIMTLVKKTGGEAHTPLVDYLEGWTHVIAQSSYKHLIPEQENILRLCHMVNIFKWMEEVGGERHVETLDDSFRVELPKEGKDALVKYASSHGNHVIQLGKALKVFVHRCLLFSEDAVKRDQPLVDYLKDSDFWQDGTFQDGRIQAQRAGLKTQLKLDDVLSATILVEHTCEVMAVLQSYMEV